MTKHLLELDAVELKVLHSINNIIETKGIRDEELLTMDYIELLDSISFVSLIVEIEKKFNISINDEQLVIENLSDFDSIVNIVKSFL